jgi:hypothetical protein
MLQAQSCAGGSAPSAARPAGGARRAPAYGVVRTPQKHVLSHSQDAGLQTQSRPAGRPTAPSIEERRSLVVGAATGGGGAPPSPPGAARASSGEEAPVSRNAAASAAALAGCSSVPQLEIGGSNGSPSSDSSAAASEGCEWSGARRRVAACERQRRGWKYVRKREAHRDFFQCPVNVEAVSRCGSMLRGREKCCCEQAHEHASIHFCCSLPGA